MTKEKENNVTIIANKDKELASLKAVYDNLDKNSGYLSISIHNSFYIVYITIFICFIISFGMYNNI